MVLFMKRIIAAAFAAMLAAPAAAADRNYTLTDFDRVQVDGPYQVSLATGLSAGARARGSAEALDRVSVEVQGRTLRIRTNRSAWGGYPGDRAGPVIIEATTRDLVAGAVTGSGSLVIDKAKGLRLDLSVSGSGRLGVANVEADNLIVGLLGSGRIAIGGKARQLRATIQGSGDFEGRALSVQDAVVFADTAGTVAVGASRSAKVTATGPGDVTVIGSPSCTLDGAAAALVKCGRQR
jgi:hypothetical protein